jgi:hypothetical protein
MCKRHRSPLLGKGEGLLVAGLLIPGSAFAECLGQGCYDDLAYILAAMAAVVLGLVITLVVLLLKRKFRAALILIGMCVSVWFILAFSG